MKGTALSDLDGAAFAALYGCGRFDATVLGNRFRYLLDHVSERLLACAFSPVLKDFYDFAATLTGPPQIGYPTPEQVAAATAAVDEEERLIAEMLEAERRDSAHGEAGVA